MTPSSLARAVPLLAALVAAASLSTGSARAAPTELFFSEYVEGSSSNKALEVYNGTGAAVTLTGAYSVQLFANGSATATATIPLTGTVADGDIFVLARNLAAPAILAQADQTTTNFLFNGNDAVALVKNGVIVDVIGQIGSDPGTEWGSGDASTADNTLRRKTTVLAGDPNGTDPFDPAAEWDGFPIDTFSGLGSHAIELPNGAPTAADDAASIPEDGGAAAIDVLANDGDPDGDPLAIDGFSPGAHGSVVLTPDGNGLTYEPEPDFSGADSFTYSVSDGKGGVDSATVSVTVTPVNDDPEAADDSATVGEDAALVIDVLGNDADVDGDELTITGATGGAHGTVSIAQDGTGVSYAPAANFNGTDAFTYTVSDGSGGTDTATVSVTVVAVNDPPEAVDDVAATSTGTPVTVDVLANDADVDGDALSVGWTGQGAAGSAAVNPDGTVTYTPSVSFSGSDSFTYAADDGHGATDTATVVVEVAPGLAFDWSGFFPPVDDLPPLNAVKAGSAVPVKFSLGGDRGLDVLADGYPKSQQIPCDSTAPVDGIEETVAAGSSGLRYDPSADHYVYVWKTQRAWAGTCRQLVLELADGSFHRAIFRFT